MYGVGRKQKIRGKAAGRLYMTDKHSNPKYYAYTFVFASARHL
jgi:hypothetical protein